MITRSDMLYLPWSDLTSAEAQRYKAENTFWNKQGEPVPAYFETKNHLILPREFKLDRPFKDETTAPGTRKRMAFAKDKKPYKFQMAAIYSIYADMLAGTCGLLVCRTGGGKTVMGLKIATLLRQKTLILVDTLDLMAQWAVRIKTYVPDATIAFYYGAKKNKSGWETADFVVATFQTVAKGVPDAFRRAFGLLMVDECHVASAPTFLRCVTMIRAKWRLGLTATPYREDKLQGLFFANLGPTLYEIAKKDVDALGVTIDPDVYVRDTELFISKRDIPMMLRWDPVERRRVRTINHAKLLTEISLSDEHNDTIKHELKRAVERGRKILCISDRNDQLKMLHKWCHEEGIDASIITGDIKDLEKRVAAFTAQVVFSNFKIVEKGLDCPELDTLFFLSVRKAKASVVQAVGRVSRNFPGKKKPIVVVFRPQVGLVMNQVEKVLDILYDLGCNIKSE